MASEKQTFLFTPFDGRPGTTYDKWELELLDAGAGIVDDYGWSVSDHLLGSDAGGATGPPIAGTASEVRKANAARRKRNKSAYALITRHLADESVKNHISTNHFQDSGATLTYLQGFRSAMDALQLRDLKREFDDVDILTNIGVNENTITLLVNLLRYINNKRPAAARFTESDITERMLECIFTCSKHFSETALTEFNAVAGARQFEHVPPHPLAGQRDLAACEAHFHALWKQAVKSRHPGFHVREPVKKPAPVRHTVEQGLGAFEGTPREIAYAGDALDTVVPRPLSPSVSLNNLALAGNDLAARRGTVTTTDFGMFSADQLCDMCESGMHAEDDGDEAALVSVYDDNDTASVDALCDNCRGAGHFKRVCPSPKKFRSFAYVAALLSRQQQRLKSTPMRRPPPRGQRPPFRAQPRRFQPRDKRAVARSAEEGADDDELKSPELATVGEEHANAANAATATVLPPPPPPRFEPPASGLPAPTPFSDDALFEAERELGRVALEPTEQKAPVPTLTTPTATPATPTTARVLASKALQMLTVTIVLAGIFVAMVGEGLSKLTTAICSIGIAASVGLALGMATPTSAEMAYVGSAVGTLNSRGLAATVDSGATSTSIPIQFEWMLKNVTDPNPNRSLWIADNKALPIKKIGGASFPALGYHKDDPSKTLVATEIPSTRTLVVDGLGPRTILLSAKGMKRDGVLTFLNNDNSVCTSDCLLVKDTGMVIPFDQTNAYQISLAQNDTANSVTDTITTRRNGRNASLIHQAMGHSGQARMSRSNLMIDGVALSTIKHDPLTCKGCRLGNTGRRHKRTKAMVKGRSTVGFTHYGQQIESDVCSGFAPSFPHGFTSMVNFKDRASAEPALYLLKAVDSSEIKSSLEQFCTANKTRLPNGMVGRWVTDNGLNFTGSETQAVADALVAQRGFSVPNDSDSLAVPERHWGVLERMIRSDLAHAGAGECCWSWSASQNNRLLYYLPTAAHDPPMSPHQWHTKDALPVDISWARTMFCDVTVTAPERDWHGKLGQRSCDGCHLGYDARRNAHFVYCPSLQRIGSFTVTEWREHSFEHCKRISSDTPVEYFEAHDLAMSDVTAALVPRRHRAHAAVEPLRIALICAGVPSTLQAALEARHHNVTVYDNLNGSHQDVRQPAVQDKIISTVPDYDFFFLSPPCLTGSIAFVPALRTKVQIDGVDGLTPRHQNLVDDSNRIWHFCGKLLAECRKHNVKCVLESCSWRDSGPAKWPQFAAHGFIWDFLKHHYPTVHAWLRYLAFAQCAFGADWQKYTGLGIAPSAFDAFFRLFGHAICTHGTHALKLQGYDATTGVANTSIAQSYIAPLAQAFCSGIEDSCARPSVQEGERAQVCTERAQVCASLYDEEFSPRNSTDDQHLRQWTDNVHAMSRNEFLDNSSAAWASECNDKALTAMDKALKTANLEDQQANETNIPIKIEFISSIPTEFTDHDTGHSISEGPIPLPKTVGEAMKSPHWPLFKRAMEDEIAGKMSNKAWTVVPRPQDKHVMKGKWVFRIIYNEDGSIKKIKARYVACGYSQTTDDYDQVFASQLSSISLRFLCSCIAEENLETDHIDAVKAFTQANVDRELYVEMAIGFSVSGYVLKLWKALEGIKQGANLWFGHNSKALKQCGCTSWTNEPNLYCHQKYGFRVGVFADDTLAGYKLTLTHEYKTFKKAYSVLINIESLDICPVVKFVGVQISRNRQEKTITLHQSQYIQAVAEEYKGKFELQETPHGSSKEDRAAFDNLEAAPESERMDTGEYLQLLGKLVWPSNMTRPDVSMEVSWLCSFVQCCGKVHYGKALNVLGYLTRTKDLGITFGGKLLIPMGLTSVPDDFYRSRGLYIAHDSSWGKRPHPMGGHVIMMCNGPVSWSAKQQKQVPQSSAEAETIEGSRAAKDGMFVRNLAENNGVTIKGPTLALGDNKAMIDSVEQEGASVRTRYYERATLFYKRAVLLLILKPLLVKTEDMMADIMTKATDKGTYFKMRNAVMNITSNLKSQLEQSMSALHGTSKQLARQLFNRFT